jgi:hypothetical protein
LPSYWTVIVLITPFAAQSLLSLHSKQSGGWAAMTLRSVHFCDAQGSNRFFIEQCSFFWSHFGTDWQANSLHFWVS